jgi:hypothetical protein
MTKIMTPATDMSFQFHKIYGPQALKTKKARFLGVDIIHKSCKAVNAWDGTQARCSMVAPTSAATSSCSNPVAQTFILQEGILHHLMPCTAHLSLPHGPVQLVHGQQAVNVVGELMQHCSNSVGVVACLGLLKHPLGGLVVGRPGVEESGSSLRAGACKQ